MSGKDVKISAVIIAYNEEINIGRCIDSLEGIADEVVVVDSYSTDETVKICREKGARIIQHEFEGHIQQKNYALDQAQNDHVISLDADEALDGNLRSSIMKVKSDFQFDGYYFNRLTNYCGKWIKHCGWYPDRKLRLWDKRKGKWGGINPHDRVVMEPGSKVKQLKGDILHYSYHDLNQHIEQIKYFTDINSSEAYKQAKKSSIIKIILKPVVKFIRDYFIKAGFMDGYYGFVICINSAFATYLKYIKLYELNKKSGKV